MEINVVRGPNILGREVSRSLDIATSAFTRLFGDNASEDHVKMFEEMIRWTMLSALAPRNVERELDKITHHFSRWNKALEAYRMDRVNLGFSSLTPEIIAQRLMPPVRFANCIFISTTGVDELRYDSILSPYLESGGFVEEGLRVTIDTKPPSMFDEPYNLWFPGPYICDSFVR